LIGLRSEVVYEGQAAMELEVLAARKELGDPYPFAMGDEAPITLDVSPMMRAIVGDIEQGVPTDIIAGRFHATMAALLAATCRQVREKTGLNIVALSGGVFQNRLLLERLMALLEGMAFQVYINRRVPPNDGGLSLGQLAIAAARLQAK